MPWFHYGKIEMRKKRRNWTKNKKRIENNFLALQVTSQLKISPKHLDKSESKRHPWRTLFQPKWHPATSSTQHPLLVWIEASLLHETNKKNRKEEASLPKYASCALFHVCILATLDILVLVEYDIRKSNKILLSLSLIKSFSSCKS